MNNSQTAPAGNQLRPDFLNQYATSPWMPLLVFILFTFAITAGGYFVFQSYKESAKIEVQGAISGIAELKTAQLVHWMDERRGEVQILRSDPLFLAEVERWLQHGGQAGESKTQLIERLASMQQANTAFGYTSISLFDDKALLRLSTSAEEDSVQEHEKLLMLESMRNGQLVLSDMHMGKRGMVEVVETDLVAPLYVGKGKQAHAIGAILVHIDPNRFIFPLIQRWPTPSSSAESLLVRRDGDAVVFLNELRHRKNTPLAMRLPLNPRLMAAMAVTGRDGLVEGLDYRGVPVVGVLSKVAGTSWFMVSKIDKAEIFEPINRLADWVMLLMLALVGTGGGIAVFWRKKELKLHDGELNRQRLAKHLDYLAKYANDIILLLDDKGGVVDFNDRAIEAYGYSDHELSNLNIDDLRAIDFSLSPFDRYGQVDQAGGALVFESMHVRHDGELFPIEASMRCIDISGEKFYQVIIRDITERKLAELELSVQKSFIRQVIDSDPNFIFVKDANGRFLLANDSLAKSYGQTTDSIVGKLSSEFVHNFEHTAAYDSANREVLENRKARVEIEAGVLENGEHRWFKTIRKPLEQADGEVCVLTIATDITELKLAEEKLQRTNRALKLLSACDTALVHIASEEQLLAEVCKLIVKTGGYKMAWVGMAEHNLEKNVRPVARYGSDDGYLDSANISWADTEHGRGTTGAAIRTGTTQVNQSFMTSSGMEPWRIAALERGFQSNISLPFRSGEHTFGMLAIYSASVDAFNADEVILLEELADNLAWGITALRMRIEHKRFVEQLRQSEEHFRFLTENATDMIYLMSMADGHYGYVSPSSIHLTGYTPKEFYNSPKLMQAIIHPVWRAYCEVQWGRCREGDIPAQLEFQIIHKNGETRWLHQRNAPVQSMDGNGTMTSVQCVVTDITERRKVKEREIRLSHVLDSTKDMIFIFEPGSLRFVYMNKGAIDGIGYGREELLLMTPFDIKPLLSEAEFRKFISPLISGEKEMLRFETVHRRKNGTDFPVEVQLQLVLEASGDSVFVAVVRDITERLLAEKELQGQKAFMWQVIDSDPNRIFVKDTKGNFLLVNQSAAAAHGLTPIEMTGRNLRDINGSTEEVAGYLDADRRVIEEGIDFSMIEPYTLPCGEQRWLLTFKKRLTMPDGTLSVLGIAVDITEQKLSEIKLAESYRKLQRLSLHMENVRTDERARIALNLHDEMGATLVAIKMGAAWLASKLPAGMPQLNDETAHITQLATDGIRVMHQIVTELRPNLLSDVGLAAGLKDYVKKFWQHTSIECILVLPDEELVLDADQSFTLFRILQESLNNVLKHAQADRVKIHFTKRGESLMMVVKDNGIGFDSSMHREQSFGLLGIRERALMIGGKARISSTPGKGVRVSVSIPYS